jgi:MFS family permease
LHGWRLILLLTSLFTGLFLSFLDTTIVAVALPVIASQFNDFSHASWVLTAYLLTYMAFAIIISRFSDLFGKKTVEVASFTVFIAFSLGCGLSQSMTQLIILRALQGIGGSGLYSMMMVIGLNAVQPTRRALIGAGIGVVMVVSGILGPVLSGAITGDRTSDTWRWIFYLNIPVGGAALAALLVAWPIDRSEKLFTRNAAKTIDVLGCILLLAASVLLIFALEEAGAYVYLWDSPVIITCLVISGVAAVAFVAWQQCISAHPDWTVKLIFPMSMLGHRVVGASIL